MPLPPADLEEPAVQADDAAALARLGSDEREQCYDWGAPAARGEKTTGALRAVPVRDELPADSRDVGDRRC